MSAGRWAIADAVVRGEAVVGLFPKTLLITYADVTQSFETEYSKGCKHSYNYTDLIRDFSYVVVFISCA